MALATRCPNCQILFRVVADQLKLRGGLVRCGACRHVFDAIGSLTYIEDGAAALPEPRPPARKAAPPTLHITAGAATVARRSPGDPKARSQPAADPSESELLGPPTLLAPEGRGDEEPVHRPDARLSGRVEPKPLAKEDGRRRHENRSPPKADSAADAKPGADEDGANAQPDAETARKVSARRRRHRGTEEPESKPPAVTLPGSHTGAGENTSPPEFLRAASSRRGFSLIFGGGSALLAVLLLLQLAVVFRTELTTRWPQWRPGLVQVCALFGCNIGWPTRAELLAVVGTELQAVPGTDVLELTAVIRNRASFKVALPAIEVTLTDTTNRTLARKVFAPVDYLASAGEPSSRIDDGLGAGSDYTIRVAFEARGVTAVGFVVYPFYL